MPELPFLHRELAALFGGRRAFWLLVLVVSLSCLLPLARWPSAPAPALAASRAPDAGPVLLLFFWTLITAGMLVVPSITAGAIAGERERGTYDLLRAAPVLPLSIVLPKAAACMLYLMILILATVPAMTVLHFLGGATLSSILRCYAVTFVAVLGAGVIGLVASLRSRRTSQAALKGAGLVLLWNAGPVIVPLVCLLALLQFVSIQRHGLVLGATPRRFAADAAAKLWAILAFLALATACLFASVMALFPTVGCSPHLAVLGELNLGAALFGGGDLRWASVFYLVYGSLVALGHLVFLLDATAVAETHERPRFDEPAAPYGLNVPPPSKSPRSFLTQALVDLGEAGARPFRNPVFLREARTELHGGVVFRRLLFWGLFAFLALLLPASFAPHSWTSGWITGGLCAASALAAFTLPAVAAPSFAREVEEGSLDFLRGTRLTMAEVLSGKLLAALASMGGVFGAVLCAAPIGLLARVAAPGTSAALAAAFGLGLLVLLATVFFTATLSLAFSVLLRRSLPAMLASYAAVVVLFLLPLVGSLWLPAGRRLFDSMSPFLAIFAAAREARGGPPPALHALAFAAAYGALALGLWIATRRYAERRVARER
ncbi:MAG: hypothetical protein HY721_18665 [Planctomycetes bacterium]|nr:hypothetical protein [Planctomycetota bacterium]